LPDDVVAAFARRVPENVCSDQGTIEEDLLALSRGDLVRKPVLLQVADIPRETGSGGEFSVNVHEGRIRHARGFRHDRVPSCDDES
jgi:hypothetical protein